MRELNAALITETVKRLCVEANCYLPGDMKACIEQAHSEEKWPQAKEILEGIDSYIVEPGLGTKSGATGALLLAQQAYAENAKT